MKKIMKRKIRKYS